MTLYRRRRVDGRAWPTGAGASSSSSSPRLPGSTPRHHIQYYNIRYGGGGGGGDDGTTDGAPPTTVMRRRRACGRCACAPAYTVAYSPWRPPTSRAVPAADRSPAIVWRPCACVCLRGRERVYAYVYVCMCVCVPECDARDNPTTETTTVRSSCVSRAATMEYGPEITWLSARPRGRSPVAFYIISRFILYFSVFYLYFPFVIILLSFLSVPARVRVPLYFPRPPGFVVAPHTAYHHNNITSPCRTSNNIISVDPVQVSRRNIF